MSAKNQQKPQDAAPKPNGPGGTQRSEGAQDERRDVVFGTHPWRR